MSFLPKTQERGRKKKEQAHPEALDIFQIGDWVPTLKNCLHVVKDYPDLLGGPT